MRTNDYNAHAQLRAAAAARYCTNAHFADALHAARVCASDARASELRAAYRARRQLRPQGFARVLAVFGVSL